MASTLSRCSRARLSSLHTHRMLGFGLGVSQRRHIAARATAILQEVDDEVLLQPLLPSTSNIPGKEVSSTSQRVEQLKKHAKPFSEFLTDGFGRQHTYLRISVTERCNLRCVYCMPEEGVPLSPAAHLLSTPEILEIARLFVSQGVTKIRLTGGEPTVRKDIVELVEELGKLRSMGLKEVCMTSNGIALNRKLPKMVEAGLTGLNLSLDTLDPWKFQIMTRRKGLEQVLKTIDTALSYPQLQVKLNCVIMTGLNDVEIASFVEMTRDKPIEVRFIEYMPFDGNKWNKKKMVSYASMVKLIHETHPTLQKLASQRPNDTSKTWQVPGYAGTVGFITSMTHNFCGSCNRLRITGDGNLKVCLFGDAEVSLRDMIRKFRDRDAEVGAGEREGMESDLLEVVGKAVGRKKEKHAGMGKLENMKNRPMILIGGEAYEHTALGVPFWGVGGGSFLSSSAIIRGSGNILSKNLSLLPSSSLSPLLLQARAYSTHKPVPSPSALAKTKPPSLPSAQPTTSQESESAKLTHLTPTGEAHMVNITAKSITSRSATAVGRVYFSNPTPLQLIRSNALKKGDVLGVARIAGIMAVKKCPDIVPLCHPILITGVSVSVETHDMAEGHGYVQIEATVECAGQTGVEMEALTAVMGAGLTVVDMCKAVDKRMVVGDCRVTRKIGGRSGEFVE